MFRVNQFAYIYDIFKGILDFFTSNKQISNK